MRKTSITVLAALSVYAGHARADSGTALHWAAWDSSFVWCDRIPAVRYSYYAARTLAVPRPEVYLLADQLFSQVVENLPGSLLAYRKPDVRDIEFYLGMARREFKGRPFAWSQWTVYPDSVGDPDSILTPDLSWLDRRLPSVAVLLRAASPRLTTAEAAATRYCQMRRMGRTAEGLFLIIDVEGRGYLCDDTVIWAGGLGAARTQGWSTIAPALVFNERSVYYPLFGRDDRESDSALKALVGKLATGSGLMLPMGDLQRIRELKYAAVLPDDASLRMAVLAAAGLADTDDPQSRAAWLDCLGMKDTTTLGSAMGMLAQTYYWADRLSPAAAAMAAAVEGTAAPAALETLQDRYLSLCGRQVELRGTPKKVVREAWGVLWSYGLIEIGLDDAVRTRAGSGLSQANAMSAVLDLAGMPHFGLFVRMGDRQIPDQYWLLTQDGRFQFNMGVWTQIADTSRTLRRWALVLSGYWQSGHWVRLGDGMIWADVDNLTVSQDLSRIERQLPLMSIMCQTKSNATVPSSQLLADLVADRYHLIPLPWPRRGTSSSPGAEPR